MHAVTFRLQRLDAGFRHNPLVNNRPRVWVGRNVYVPPQDPLRIKTCIIFFLELGVLFFVPRLSHHCQKIFLFE